MSQPKPLNGRRIVVTGGSSGIGRALVRAYAQAGADVLAVGRSLPALEASVSGLESASTVAADLTTDAGRRSVADAAAHRSSGIDVVVHAAGALGPVRSDAARLVNYPADAWYTVFEINMSAVHFLHQRLAPLLDESPAPTVIGVSSSVGRAGRAEWGMYAVSKFALEGWLEILDDEWDGRVYSVNPGGTATPMRAAAMPEEDPSTIPGPEDIMPVFLHLALANPTVPSGAKLLARDWIGRDPFDTSAAADDGF